MESPRKKLRRVVGFESLPDEVVAHILSFMTFKEAVMKSGLGRRWRHQWLRCRSIDLDEQLLLKFAGDFAARYAESRMESFRLVFSFPEEYPSEVWKWILAATSRKVASLDLDFSDPETDWVFDFGNGKFNLPAEIFELHQSLTSLSLSACEVLPHRFLGLHALRRLSLSRIFVRKRTFHTLLANLPLLEELYLKHLDIAEVYVAGCSRGLRKLTVDNCLPLDIGIRLVHAPALESFHYCGAVVPFEIEQIPRIVDVDVSFTEDDFMDGGDPLRDLLQNIYNAEALTVCGYLPQVIPRVHDPGRLPTVGEYNHRQLIINGVAFHREEIPGIALLLRSYTLLETLTIRLSADKKRLDGYEFPLRKAIGGSAFWDKELEIPFPCMEDNLRYVKLEGFTGQMNQVEFVEFLLTTARSLRELIICVSREPSKFGHTMERRWNIVHSLLYCPRASDRIRIDIE
ncbi:unnamed protein product [Spirodela intermedia]|uniref:Uncharacterized protein n=1 Tax=Spirodela intermedia TaxID=51605 RepID=A0A7I8ILM0_SPIIN|nr:unnamed protein product [Spirodela intermedia]CAA6658316.1 unnamed protein product [Spirodela intermedia]